MKFKLEPMLCGIFHVIGIIIINLCICMSHTGRVTWKTVRLVNGLSGFENTTNMLLVDMIKKFTIGRVKLIEEFPLKCCSMTLSRNTPRGFLTISSLKSSSTSSIMSVTFWKHKITIFKHKQELQCRKKRQVLTF